MSVFKSSKLVYFLKSTFVAAKSASMGNKLFKKNQYILLVPTVFSLFILKRDIIKCFLVECIQKITI